MTNQHVTHENVLNLCREDINTAIVRMKREYLTRFRDLDIDCSNTTSITTVDI